MSKRDETLRDMGYMAHLIVRLLEIGGPMTTEQIHKWINDPHGENAGGDLLDVLRRMRDKGILRQGDAALWHLFDDSDDDEPILMALDLLDRNSATFAGDPGNHTTISRLMWREYGFPTTIAVRLHTLETE